MQGSTCQWLPEVLVVVNCNDQQPQCRCTHGTPGVQGPKTKVKVSFSSVQWRVCFAFLPEASTSRVGARFTHVSAWLVPIQVDALQEKTSPRG